MVQVSHSCAAGAGARAAACAVALLVVFALVVSRRPDVLATPQFLGRGRASLVPGRRQPRRVDRARHPGCGLLPDVSALDGARSAWRSTSSTRRSCSRSRGSRCRSYRRSLLLSSRFAESIPSLPLAALAALLLVGLPNTWEVHGNVTNAQHHLALAEHPGRRSPTHRGAAPGSSSTSPRWSLPRSPARAA